MNDFPREMRQGDVVSATEYNRLVRCVRRLALIQGPGVKLSFRPNGTVISAVSARAATSASAPVFWSFSPQSGWSNCLVVFGYQAYWLDHMPPSVVPTTQPRPHLAVVDGLEVVDPGCHYLKANLATGAMEIVVVPGTSLDENGDLVFSGTAPENDYINSIVYVYLGAVVEKLDDETGEPTGEVFLADAVHAPVVLYRYV